MSSLGLKSRLMCHIVDDLAQHQPDQLFCLHPVSVGNTREWRRITFKDLAAAVSYTAWWIDKTVGPGTKSEPLAYMGVNDIRYVVFLLACMKTGYAALLPSTRNSEMAFLHVLGKTACSKFVYSVERQKQVQELQQAQKSMRLWEIPGLWEIFDGEAEFYHCKQQFEDVEDVASIIIHSSGSTGYPKPVYLTHGFWSVFDNVPSLHAPPDRCSNPFVSSTGGHRSFFTMAPFFHLMGLFVAAESIFHGTSFILGPEKPLTSDLLANIIDETRPQAAMFPPSVIEDLASTPRGLATLKRLETIYFGGAPLSKDVGDELCQDIILQAVLGSSEAGFIPNLIVEDKSDWQYFEWNPTYGVAMQPVGDEEYEMVLHRGAHREFHAIFHTYPDSQEYHTKDLFVKHPTTPGLWRYHGRLDDVIVLSNGEKFNPIEMEKVLDGHALVARSIVVGQGRFQPALLVEPRWTAWDGSEPESSFIDQIWSTVEKANEIAPGHGRILKSKIGLASISKPFKTTPKGSIQRRQVVADYVDEVDLIYSRSDEEYVGKLPQDAAIEDVTQYIHGAVVGLLSVDQIEDTADIFALGLDSLQTLQLSKILQGAVLSLRPESDFSAITSQKLYAYPSVAQLSKYVYGLAHGSDPGADASTDSELERVKRVSALVEKYTDDLPTTNQIPSFHRTSNHSVILTGSTGSLGNYLLHELLADPTITKIYCLNRSPDALARQLTSFAEKGLPIPTDFHRRVEFLHADFGAAHFGLAETKYAELLDTVDAVTHNAWAVNFNHHVSAFEQTHIAGVRRLIDFSLASTHTAHIHFISSISTIGAWGPRHGPSIPETPIDDVDVVLRQGYGESKFVGERICALASARAGVPTSVYRVGQIAGPTTEGGVWNRQEWLPALVATAKALGAVPDSLGAMPVDWIPVDSLAKIITEITRSRRLTETPLRTAAFHLLNPTPVPWSSLLPAIRAHHPSISTVSFPAWLRALDAFSSPTAADLRDKPALKILDFYRGLAGGAGEFLSSPAETAEARGASETMQGLGGVDGGMMGNWLRQWDF